MSARSLRTIGLFTVMTLICAMGMHGVAAEQPAGPTVRHAFTTDPGWEGYRNRLLPDPLPVVRQDFGYRPTQLAGGQPGEIGGTVYRTVTPAWYAKVIEEKTLDDRLSASGRFAVRRADAGSGVMFGWFHHDSRGWRTPNSLGFRIDGNGGSYWLFFEYGTQSRQTGGGGAFQGERYQTTTTKPFLADGTIHTWSLDYDPRGASGNGQITFRVDERTYRVALAPEHRQAGASLDRFGIWNVQIGGQAMEVYFDDLVLDGQSEPFDHDPQWEGHGNHVEFAERVIRPLHDFGFSRTRHAGGTLGEIGGTIFRDTEPAYYAAPVARLSLEHPLYASGRVVLLSAGADSGVYLGWFDAASHRETHRQTSSKPKNFLGVMIEGPSRVGHYFRAAYYDSARQGLAPTADQNTGTPRPVIDPDAKPHRWSLRYDPQAAGGHGRITVRLDQSVHTLDLRPEHRARGATFDHFGLLNIRAGGHHVQLFLDDLVYTASSDGSQAETPARP